MLVVGSNLLNFPILSLHVGGEIAHTTRAVIDPEELSVIAYVTEGAEKDEPEAGNILMISDVREFGDDGFIIDSVDKLVVQNDVIKLDEIMKLEFDLVGLKVVDKDGKKLGKVINYTVDSGTFTIFQIIVQRPFFDAFIDPELTINRSQIVEIDDNKITVKNSNQKVRLSKPNSKDDFVPNYVNPFRKPSYSEEYSEDEADSSSNISE